MFENMLEISEDIELGLFKVAPLEEGNPDRKYAVVFKEENQAKHFLVSLSKKEIPSPVENHNRYKLMGTHSDGVTKVFIYKG